MEIIREKKGKPAPTSVMLDEPSKVLLDELAQSEDRSRSAVVRRAIVAYAESTDFPAASHGAS